MHLNWHYHLNRYTYGVFFLCIHFGLHFPVDICFCRKPNCSYAMWPQLVSSAEIQGKLVRATKPKAKPQLANAGQMIHRLHCIYHELQTNWISPASPDTLQIKRCCQLADKCKSSNKSPSLSDPRQGLSFAPPSPSLSHLSTSFFRTPWTALTRSLGYFPAIRVSVTIAFAFRFSLSVAANCEKRKEY